MKKSAGYVFSIDVVKKYNLVVQNKYLYVQNKVCFNVLTPV